MNKLLELLQKSDIELFDQFLEIRNLSCSKPAEYLHALRKIVNDCTFTLLEDVLKIKFIKCLLESFRGPISLMQNESLDELAKRTNVIMQYNPPPALTVAIGYTDTSNFYLYNAPFNNMIVGAPNNITNPVSCTMRGSLQETTHNTTNTCGCNNIQIVQHTNNNHYLTTTMLSINLRPYYRDQRPVVCRAHLYFGSKDLQAFVHSEYYCQECTYATFQ